MAVKAVSSLLIRKGFNKGPFTVSLDVQIAQNRNHVRFANPSALYRGQQPQFWERRVSESKNPIFPHPRKGRLERKKSPFLPREKLNRGVSKGVGFPTFSPGKVQIVSRTLSGLFLVVLLIGREREKGRIGKIPGPSPRKSGKSRKIPEKDKKGQKRKDKSRSGSPPRLAALDSWWWNLRFSRWSMWSIFWWQNFLTIFSQQI